MKDQYNLGIIGFGGMAGWHYTSIRDAADTNINIKGVWDVNEVRLKAAEEKGLKAYSSEAEILADPDIDIILIATTNEVHKEIAIRAMAAGKHIICEKPVTISSADLEEMIAASEKYGKVFTIDQNRRTNRDFVLMRRSVEAGLLGDVYVIESRVEGSRGMPTGWRTIKELGGGMMLDWGVHLIDQIMYMYEGAKVTSVYCKMYSIEYSEVDDNFHLTIVLDNGVTAHIEVSTNNYITHPRWYVLGKKGTLQIGDWDCKGKIVSCMDKDNVWEEEIFYTKAGPTKTMAPRNPDTVETTELTEPEDVEDSLLVVYKQLTDAIEGKAPLTITPQQALRVMKVMEAAFESNESGMSVKTNI